MNFDNLKMENFLKFKKTMHQKSYLIPMFSKIIQNSSIYGFQGFFQQFSSRASKTIQKIYSHIIILIYLHPLYHSTPQKNCIHWYSQYALMNPCHKLWIMIIYFHKINFFHNFLFFIYFCNVNYLFHTMKAWVLFSNCS